MMVHVDGIWKANVSANYYNATDFSAGTIHTIGTRTVDTSGNVNSTWANHIAWTAPPPIICNNTELILGYQDFTLEGYYRVMPNMPGKVVVYGSMTKSVTVPPSCTNLEVRISIPCNGYGEGLAAANCPSGSKATISVDGQVREEVIDNTMSRHDNSCYRYEYCQTFSNSFSVGGKNTVILRIAMVSGARLDFQKAHLVFSA